MTHYVLKVKPTKFLTVRSFQKKLQLWCLSRQANGTPVQIFRRSRNDNMQMAFCFKYKDNSYFLKVENNFLKLEETACSAQAPLSEHFWFEKSKVDDGEFYILLSVVEPKLHLSLPEKSDILGLSRSDGSVFVTAVEVAAGSLLRC